MTALTLDLSSIKLTDEQFFQLCQQNELILFERNADGTIVIMPLAGGITSNRNLNLSTQLYTWNQDKKLGIAFGSCTGFTLPNSAVRSPNTSWLKRDRWDDLTQEEKEKFAPVCPDFVVELCSDTDCLKRLQDKMQEYLENGARLGWLINFETKKVEVYRQIQEVEVLENPSTLSGEDVLPEFVMNLESIW
jgi:Uma2 family endonuclease